MSRKLGHLCMVTDQLEAMRDFYCRQLGMTVKFVFKNKQDQIFGYYIACGDSTFVEIFDRMGKFNHWGGDKREIMNGSSINHFCFEIVGMEAFRAKLEGRGVKIRNMKKEMDHSWQMWTNDPDGNSIEFMEYTGESWQLEGGPQA